MAEIIRINIDHACDFECEDCGRYFECVSPEKFEMFERGRMDIARKKMAGIKRKIVCLGGKGGVGKSTVSANLAVALASLGNSVAIVDSDFDSPCIPRMLGLHGKKMTLGKNGIEPVVGPLGVRAISMGFLIEDAEVVTWFQDMRRSATEEFLAHVNYGEVDYLVVDLPPGTSSDSVNMMEYIPNVDGAVVVTMPSQVSLGTARRATLLCQKAGIPIIGIIENFSGFSCHKCGEEIDIISSGGGKALAELMGVSYLGKIPLDDRVAKTTDQGLPFIAEAPDSPAGKAFRTIVENIVSIVENGKATKPADIKIGGKLI